MLGIGISILSTQRLFMPALASVDENVARVVLDLSDLTFIDCANIGLIHQARIVVGLRGTFLELRSLTPHVRRLFGLTGPSDSNGDTVGPIVMSVPDPAYDRPKRHPSVPMRGEYQCERS